MPFLKTVGDFDAEHCDKKDNLAYFIHMTAMSDLPDDYDPAIPMEWNSLLKNAN